MRKSNRALIVGATAAVVVATVVAGYSDAPLRMLVVLLGVLAILPWMLSSRDDVDGYVAALGVQVAQSVIILRVALSDFFILPLVARTARDVWRDRRAMPRTTLDSALIALLAVFVLANGVALARIGLPKGYILLNKDIGILFLVAGFYALAAQIRSSDDVRRVVDLFVVGVSVANVFALATAVANMPEVPAVVYWFSRQRLTGWMLNPSAYGSLVVTAVLLELPRLGEAGHSAFITRLRWVNYLLLGAGAMLTLSRSVWATLSVGAAIVLYLSLISAARGRRMMKRQVAIALFTLVTLAIPSGLLGWIVRVQFARILGLQQNVAVRTSELRMQVAQRCIAAWDPLWCPDVPVAVLAEARRLNRAETQSTAAAASPTSQAAASSPAQPTSPVRPDSAAYAIGNPDSAIMNARGMEDRAAVIQLGWHAYRSTVMTTLLGAGMGFIYGTSASAYGLPVIIHNSAAWFLVEMGPVGLVILVWILCRTVLNLKGSWDLPDWRGDLGRGLVAALGSWVAYSMFNEAFYVRHLWLILVCADRLCVLAIASPAGASMERHANV